MLFLFLESALRAAGLALLAGLGLKLFRVRNPHMMLTAWTVVLCAALSVGVTSTDGYRDGRGPGYRDRDGDGVPNRYDRDRDGDGTPNRYDHQPNNPRRD